MRNAKKTNNLDLNRRDALKRLGLAVGAAYMAPTLLSLSNAHASQGGSGGSVSAGSVSTASVSTASVSTASLSAASASVSVDTPAAAGPCLLGIIGTGC